jgi:hypothetical protein
MKNIIATAALLAAPTAAFGVGGTVMTATISGDIGGTVMKKADGDSFSTQKETDTRREKETDGPSASKSSKR